MAALEIIETYWNVNGIKISLLLIQKGNNRNILECKLSTACS